MIFSNEEDGNNFMRNNGIAVDLSNLRRIELGAESIAFTIKMGGPEEEEIGLSGTGITFWPSTADNFHYSLTWEEFFQNFPTIASKTFA